MFNHFSNRRHQTGSVEGFLGGLTTLVEKLGELAEKGEQMKREGNFEIEKDGKKFNGMYGFTVRSGIGGDRDEVKVEPFGNIKRDKITGKAVVQEVREPVIDIFDEPETIHLVAEMPGVAVDQVTAEVAEDILTLRAGKGERSYYKEIVLPAHCTGEGMSITCNNGVVEIKCAKVKSDATQK